MLALAASPALAATPHLEQLLPRGGQRGTEVALTLRGDRLDDAEALVLYGPGLEQVGPLEPVLKDGKSDGKTVRGRLRIAADCPLGEHTLRVRTRTGLSEVDTFWVGPLPSVAEVEPNGDVDRPQVVALDVTLEGTLGPEDKDGFAFVGSAGQRVSAEVEALRLGGPVVDPVLTLSLLDSERGGAPLAVSDDAPLLGQDALLSVVLPQDGRYLLTLREATYSGGDRWRYRLHLGTYARPTAAFPPGGRTGEPFAVEFLGDPAGVTSAWYPTQGCGTGGYPSQGRGTEWAVLALPDAPSGLPLRITDLPCVSEAPVDSTAVGLPVAFHGRLLTPGEVDRFVFEAKKGQRLRARAFARALGSPADLVLELARVGGKQVGANDDAAGKSDSELQVTVPEDGTYELRVRDFGRRASPVHVYRVELTETAPALSLDLATYGRNSQARNALAVPQGGRMALLVRVAREGATGPVAIALDGLPADVATLATATCAPASPTVPVVVEAAATAPLGAWLCGLEGVVVAEPDVGPVTAGVRGGLRQPVPLVTGPPNDSVYWTTTLDRLAIAVVDSSPVTLRLVPPTTPLVRDGSTHVVVEVARREGFTGPVIVSLLQDSPGTSSRKEVKVEPGQDRAVIAVTANGEAALGRWPLVAVGRFDLPRAGAGELLVSTQLETLEVAAPLVRLALTKTAAPQGGVAILAGELTVDRPFEGVAVARLVGLPAHCVAPVVTLTAASKEIRFDVTIGAEAKQGRHRQLFCELLVPASAAEGAATIRHVVGRTELRIDPPAPDAPPPPPPDPNAPRALTRLEQLRAEHQERARRRAGGAP